MVAAASEHHLLASFLAVALVLVRVGVTLEWADLAVLPDDGKSACGTGALTGSVIVGVRVNPGRQSDVTKASSALVFALDVGDFESIRLSPRKATNS